MPIYTESYTRFWGEGCNTIYEWANGGDGGILFERIFGCENQEIDEEDLEKWSDSYRLGNMACFAEKNRDGSVSLNMNTIRTIPIGAFERIATLFPRLHADGIFIHQTEEFFGSYIIENGQFLWTQFHNPGRRSRDSFFFDSFFEKDYDSIGDKRQREILKVLELERRLLRGDKTAEPELRKQLNKFRDEKKNSPIIDFYFSKIEKKALLGDALSQFELSEEIDSWDYYDDKNIYYRNDDTEKEVYGQDWDLMKQSWLKKAAVNGNPDAQFDMVYYCMGKKAQIEATEWFKKSIFNGCKTALEIGLSEFEDYNNEPTFIDEDIISFVEDLADNNNSIQLIESLAYHYNYLNERIDNKKNKEKEEYWWEKGVEAGSLTSILGLAEFYAGKNGSKAGIQKAITLYEKAICLDSDEAMLSLAKVCSSIEDQEKAVKLYQQASEKGSSVASLELAKRFALGSGVEKDLSKSVEFFRKAHKVDKYSPAGVYLWLCSEQGLYSLSKKRYGSNLLRDLEDEGFAPDIARCFNGEDQVANALGVQKDEKQYVFWLKKAVEDDDISAIYRLGVLLFEGKLVKRNSKRAFELFLYHQESSSPLERRDEYSEYYLGLMYLNGFYIPKNLFMAKKWLEALSDIECEKAILLLKQVEEQINSENTQYDEESIAKAELFEQAVCEMYHGLSRRPAEKLTKLNDYADAPQRLEKCLKKLKVSSSDWNKQFEGTYRRALSLLNDKNYDAAKELFDSIRGWKDSAKLYEYCVSMNLKAQYESAQQLIESGEIERAKEILSSIGDQQDSKEILKDIYRYGYDKLIKMVNEAIENKKFKKAHSYLVVAKDMDYRGKDVDLLEKDISYTKAFIAFEKGEYEKSKEMFESLGDWRDSREQLEEVTEIGKEYKYNRALYYMDNKEYSEAKKLLIDIVDWKDSKALLDECDKQLSNL